MSYELQPGEAILDMATGHVRAYAPHVIPPPLKPISAEAQEKLDYLRLTDKCDKLTIQVSELKAENEKIANEAVRALAQWQRQYNTIRDERAQAFERLARIVGGVGCTAYQAEIEIEIEERVKALLEALADCRDEAERLEECRPFRIIRSVDAALAATEPKEPT